MLAKTMIVSCLLLGASSLAWSAPDETHKLRIHGTVSYRCYAGYDGKAVADERSGEKCDNKTSRKIIIDKVVSIAIRDEPDPENSTDLEGSWSEEVQFKGRKFTAAVSLFKSKGKLPYTLSITAHDDEPAARRSTMRTHLRTMAEMNPVDVEYASRGKKEETEFDLKVEAAK
jgi:hypothetical protein